MLEYALYGAMAAGLVGDIWTGSSASRVGRRAVNLEEAQLDLRLKQEVLASNEQSLFDLEQLAETLATQRAMMAVRGGLPGVGSSLALEQKSVNRFNKDEEARALSLGFAGAQRKAQVGALKVAQFGKEAQMGADIFSKAFNMIPFGEAFKKLEGTKTPKTEKPKVRTSGIPTKRPGLLSPERGFGG